MDRDLHRFQHRGFLKGNRVGQTVHDARGNGNKLCKGSRAAIVAARDSENLPLVAKIYFSTTAVTASAAADGRVESDSISHRKSRYTRTYRVDCSRRFMSHHNGGNASTRGAVVAVNVAPADATSCDAHQDFAGPDRGHRQIRNFQTLIFRKQKNFHR